MPARDNRIWVLISDGANRRICSCEDGMPTPITSPILDLRPDTDGRHLRAHTAWFKAARQSALSGNPRRQHALHVSQLLLEAAREGAYDGLIVIAPEPIAADLDNALASETRALLIGSVVRDFAPCEPAAFCNEAAMLH